MKKIADISMFESLMAESSCSTFNQTKSNVAVFNNINKFRNIASKYGFDIVEDDIGNGTVNYKIVPSHKEQTEYEQAYTDLTHAKEVDYWARTKKNVDFNKIHNYATNQFKDGYIFLTLQGNEIGNEPIVWVICNDPYQQVRKKILPIKHSATAIVRECSSTKQVADELDKIAPDVYQAGCTTLKDVLPKLREQLDYTKQKATEWRARRDRQREKATQKTNDTNVTIDTPINADDYSSIPNQAITKTSFEK